MKGMSPFQADLERYYFALYKTNTPQLSQKVRLLAINMGLHCVLVYRYGQTVRRIQKKHRVLGGILKAIYTLIKHMIVFLHKVEVGQTTEIGPGFRICHVGNVYVSARRIGENCTMTHNVTIGLGAAGPRGRTPTIGSNVWIGTGSVIAGDISIGDDVTISAGSIVTRNVPSGCLVAGNPARVIKRDYDKGSTVFNKVGDKLDSITV